MPIYGYRCEQCGHEVEVLQSMSDEPLKVCPNCMGPLRKMIYPAGIIFKGSGYYTTDYKSAGSSSRHGDSDAGASSSGSGGEAKPAASSSGGEGKDGSKEASKSEKKSESSSESKPAKEAPKSSSPAKAAGD